MVKIFCFSLFIVNCFLYNLEMIRHILFDVDNTLYSPLYGLEDAVSARVREFVLSWLDLPADEAERLWKDGYRRHGTTVEWLMHERGFTAFEEYQAFIHPENEADSLLPDPELRRFLESLPCPCSLLTNAPRFHADRVLEKLELEGVFYKIFDIIGNGLEGKPKAPVFRRALEALELPAAEVLFIDDVPRYVEGYLALGGRGLLIDQMGVHEDYPHERIQNLRELTRFLN